MGDHYSKAPVTAGATTSIQGFKKSQNSSSSSSPASTTSNDTIGDEGCDGFESDDGYEGDCSSDGYGSTDDDVTTSIGEQIAMVWPATRPSRQADWDKLFNINHKGRHQMAFPGLPVWAVPAPKGLKEEGKPTNLAAEHFIAKLYDVSLLTGKSGDQVWVKPIPRGPKGPLDGKAVFEVLTRAYFFLWFWTLEATRRDPELPFQKAQDLFWDESVHNMQYGAFCNTAQYMKLKAAANANNEAVGSDAAATDYAAAVDSPATTSPAATASDPATIDEDGTIDEDATISDAATGNNGTPVDSTGAIDASPEPSPSTIHKANKANKPLVDEATRAAARAAHRRMTPFVEATIGQSLLALGESVATRTRSRQNSFWAETVVAPAAASGAGSNNNNNSNVVESDTSSDQAARRHARPQTRRLARRPGPVVVDSSDSEYEEPPSKRVRRSQN